MQAAREGLRKIVFDTLRQAPAEEAPLLAWPVVCGPRVAEKTRALSFTEGVLRVEAPDAAWCEELAELERQYLAGFEQAPGAAVKRIEFVVARP